jgi:threonine/homoserine/homoserine lactone efflux protein
MPNARASSRSRGDGAEKGTRNDARSLGDERSGRLGLVFQSAGLAVDAVFGLAAGFARNAFARRSGLHALLEHVAATAFAGLALALFVGVLL